MTLLEIATTFIVIAILSDLIVHDFDNGETQHLALFLTFPDYRLHTSGMRSVTLLKTAVGAPSTLKQWSYHGEPTDQELVHPGSRVVYLTEAAKVAVLSMH